MGSNTDQETPCEKGGATADSRPIALTNDEVATFQRRGCSKRFRVARGAALGWRFGVAWSARLTPAARFPTVWKCQMSFLASSLSVPRSVPLTPYGLTPVAEHI